VCELTPQGEPRRFLLDAGVEKQDPNPYSRKVVVIDSCHHLVRPSLKYARQLSQLRGQLQAAQASAVIGFTGFLAGCETKESRLLLDVVKGTEAALRTDAG